MIGVYGSAFDRFGSHANRSALGRGLLEGSLHDRCLVMHHGHLKLGLRLRLFDRFRRAGGLFQRGLGRGLGLGRLTIRTGVRDGFRIRARQFRRFSNCFGCGLSGSLGLQLDRCFSLSSNLFHHGGLLVLGLGFFDLVGHNLGLFIRRGGRQLLDRGPDIFLDRIRRGGFGHFGDGRLGGFRRGCGRIGGLGQDLICGRFGRLRFVRGFGAAGPALGTLHDVRDLGHLIHLVARAGIFRVQLVRDLEGLQRIFVIVQLAVGVAQPVPGDGLVLLVREQLEALLIERDGRQVIALGDEGQAEVAVRPAHAGVQLERPAVGVDRLRVGPGLEVDVAQLMPVLRIPGIDVDRLLEGQDGLLGAILPVEHVSQLDPGIDEALVELHRLLLVGHDRIEDVA